MPLFPGSYGYPVEGDNYRTNLKLVISEGSSPSEDFLTDPNLQVLFSYPYQGSYYRPGEVQIARGTIVAVRASDPNNLATDLSVTTDYDQSMLRTVLTIANGGANVADANSYTRFANRPVGVVPYNCYRRINDRFYGNLPTIITKEYIELPYIASTALGNAMNWGCVVSNGVAGANRLRAGDILMPNTKGKFVKWDAVDLLQISARVLAVDTTVPVQGWLQWVMWDFANAAFNESQKGLFNPYDLAQPRPTPPTDGTYDYDSLYAWPEQLWDALGIPNLTDGARMAAVDYAENFVGGTIDGTTNVATINLAHTRIPKNEQAVVAPTESNSNPSRLVLIKDGVTLRENDHYRVDRYRGIVYVLSGVDGNALNAADDAYAITYTSLENQIIGIPTNWDFRGSIGAVRMQLKF